MNIKDNGLLRPIPIIIMRFISCGKLQQLSVIKKSFSVDDANWGMTPWKRKRKKRATIEEEYYGGLVEVVSNCCHLERPWYIGTAHNREERCNISAHLCYFPPYILYGAERACLIELAGNLILWRSAQESAQPMGNICDDGSLLGDLFNYSMHHTLSTLLRLIKEYIEIYK